MLFENLFMFVSPKERKRREIDFRNRIFPFGLSQRSAALNAIRPLINKSIPDDSILYAFIVSKQIYLDNKNASAQDVRKLLENQRRLSDTEKGYIAALALLDANIKSLEEYPDTEEIKRMAENMGAC